LYENHVRFEEDEGFTDDVVVYGDNEGVDVIEFFVILVNEFSGVVSEVFGVVGVLGSITFCGGDAEVVLESVVLEALDEEFGLPTVVRVIIDVYEVIHVIIHSELCLSNIFS
jgi:hypothetical protein